MSMTGVEMGLTPNQKLVLDLLGYLPILVFGVAVVDALHWIWQWNRGLLTPLQRRKRLRRYGVFFAAGMGVVAAATLFVHTLLKPVVIIDPLTGMGRLHRLGFVYILPACALVMVVLGLHMTINLIRIALYRLRRNGGQ